MSKTKAELVEENNELQETLNWYITRVNNLVKEIQKMKDKPIFPSTKIFVLEEKVTRLEEELNEEIDKNVTGILSAKSQGYTAGRQAMLGSLWTTQTIALIV